MEEETTRLKNLVDIKDEQLEMIARVHDVNNNGVEHQHHRSPSASMTAKPMLDQSRQPAHHGEPAVITPPTSDSGSDEYDEHYTVKSTVTLGADSSYMGVSGGAAFVMAFMDKLSQKVPEATLSVRKVADAVQTPAGLVEPPSEMTEVAHGGVPYVPSRMAADRLVSIYFQEWQSIYAILDQGEFLRRYEEYFEYPERDPVFAATVALVCALGSLAAKDAVIGSETWRLDAEWRRLLSPAEAIAAPSLATQQALLLAELYAMHTGAVDDMWRFRMASHSMAQRLGLHRDARLLRTHSGDALPAADIHMRGRLAWVAYELDVFASAALGAARLFRDTEMECPIPSAAVWDFSGADDTTATTTTSLPDAGPVTSCQLAVVKLSRTIAQILDCIYSSTKKSHSFKELVVFEDELESWRRELAPELKFEFANNQPAPTLQPLHQKSPLLNQLYHYARILLHLPIVSAPADENNMSRGSGSNVAVMQSAKTFIQVFSYLRERNVTPTLPLCNTRALVLCGGIVLYGAVDYSRSGALIRQARKTITACLGFMYADSKARRPGAISGPCYQWLEEAADLALKRKQQPPQQRRSSSGSATSSRKPLSPPVSTGDHGSIDHNPPHIKLEELTPSSDGDLSVLDGWFPQNHGSIHPPPQAHDWNVGPAKDYQPPHPHQHQSRGHVHAAHDFDPLDLYCCIEELAQSTATPLDLPSTVPEQPLDLGDATTPALPTDNTWPAMPHMFLSTNAL